MKVLVVGSGGREHAIAWRLAKSSLVSKIFIAPGNGGTDSVAESVPLKVSQIEEIAEFAAREQIDLTVVGPEEPLSLGLADALQERGLSVFGPTKAAAQIESSKAFAKDVMLKAGVLTARGAVFTDFTEAKAYVESEATPPVIKADGLAAGKGVVVPESKEEAIEALKEMLLECRFSSSPKVVLEERLYGREASVIALVSGETVLPMVISSDHKRIFDGDKGPNTGGMGAISPTPVLSEERLPELVETIFRPVVRELKSRGIDYCGFLYAGVMVLPDGRVSVIEFNCRLGDPEAQVLMMRLESDLADLLQKAVNGNLDGVRLQWSESSAAVVVLASAGYPGTVKDGEEIAGLFSAEDDLIVFHAGTRLEEGKTLSKGGRVLGVTALGPDLKAALSRCYEGVSRITFPGMQYRKDIGVNR
jgi:phosphoribosylamine--glycine ligase